MDNARGQVISFRHGWRTLCAHERRLLLSIYLAATILHLVLLFPLTAVPLIFPDEAHYCDTGNNILWGNGYVARGEFSATVPPVEPLLIAVAHASARHGKTIHFFLSTLIMCAAVFPVYFLARHLSLPVSLAAMVSLAAVLNPFTDYSATYMSESLQYPILLWAVLVAVLWMETEAEHLAIKLGFILGVMALTRYATATFVIALVIATVVRRLLDPAAGIWRRGLKQLAIVCGIYAVFQGGWWAFKLFHGASMLGAYSSNLRVLPYLSVWLIASYIGDAMFAPGPLTAGPLTAAFAFLKRERPAALAVLGTVTVVLVLSTAFFDGGLTGQVRGRFYIYVFPLLSLLAVIGARSMKRRNRIATFGTFFLPGAAAVFLLYAYARSGRPMSGTPWAEALGTLQRHGLGAFRASSMLLWALGLAAVSSLAVSARRRHPEMVVALAALAINGGAFVSRTILGKNPIRDAQVRLQPILRAIPDALPHGTRVFISSVPEGLGYTAHPGWFGVMNYDLGLSSTSVFQLEIMRGLDVRVVDSEAELNSTRVPGALLLSASAFPQLPLVSHTPGFRLYRLIQGLPLTSGRDWYLPAASFVSPAGTLQADGAIHGGSDGRAGFLVTGPYRPLPFGEYEAIFDFDGRAGLSYHAEITDGGPIVAQASLSTARRNPAHFRIDAPGVVEFRIRGANTPDFIFRGLGLKLVSGPA